MLLDAIASLSFERIMAVLRKLMHLRSSTDRGIRARFHELLANDVMTVLEMIRH